MTITLQALPPSLLAAVLGASLLGMPASAATSSSPLPQTSAQAVESQRDAWLEAAGLTLGANQDGSWIGFGSKTIESAPSPTWGAARIAAFEQAESAARASFVEMMGITVTTESLGSLFQDDAAFEELLASSAGRKSDKLASIESKLLELSGPDLLSALELLGLDAEALAAMDEPEKRTALAESFKSRVATRAARQLRGLRVIQTFEAHGAETHTACVLIRWSAKNAKLAEVVRSGQGSITSAREGRPLAEWLPEDDAEFLRDWGVRVFPGPGGEPIIVCFSQAAIGLAPEDPPRAREAKRRAALMRAKSFALRDLTLFINATTVVDQVATRGETFEVSMKLFPDGFADHDSGSSALTRTLERTVKTLGQAVITGGEVLRSWSTKFPGTEAEFCGVVYAWSPTRARLAYDFAAGKPSDDDSQESSGNDYPVDF